MMARNEALPFTLQGCKGTVSLLITLIFYGFVYNATSPCPWFSWVSPTEDPLWHFVTFLLSLPWGHGIKQEARIHLQIRHLLPLLSYNEMLEEYSHIIHPCT